MCNYSCMNLYAEISLVFRDYYSRNADTSHPYARGCSKIKNCVTQNEKLKPTLSQ